MNNKQMLTILSVQFLEVEKEYPELMGQLDVATDDEVIAVLENEMQILLTKMNTIQDSICLLSDNEEIRKEAMQEALKQTA